MKSLLLSSLLLGTLGISSANASVLAIVDSGNDFTHKDLVLKTWTNPIEIAGNDRDEDRNGYPDDVNGWNFAEANNQLIDYKYSYSYNPDTKRFFDIQLKAFLGTITEDDRNWYKEKIQDEAFVKALTVFGNWMHGTHVTGIAVKNAADTKVMGLKLIPTEVKLPGQKDNSILIETKGLRSHKFLFEDKSMKDSILMALLSTLAKQQSQVYSEIGDYLKFHKVEVMNGSFGVPYSAIEGLLTTLFEKVFKKKPTEQELKKFTDYFFSVLLEENRTFLSSSPNTLFIFAAGNEGLNNDQFPSSPTNVQAENKISVAASLGDMMIANFSNFGVNNVDVAAPGVGIVSTIPMDNHLAVSGTSQAAPYVANMAVRIKDINPSLNYRAIKKIILDTVDVKPWLVGKVRTSGLVNMDRALRAAELSKSMEISAAISKSKVEVLAKTQNDLLSLTPVYQIPRELVTPMPNPIVVK